MSSVTALMAPSGTRRAGEEGQRVNGDGEYVSAQVALSETRLNARETKREKDGKSLKA